jgi:uncharacterized protein YkwD
MDQATYGNATKEVNMHIAIKIAVSATAIATALTLGTFEQPDRSEAASSVVSAVRPIEQVPGVLAAVNEYRSTKHLPPLALNDKLNSSSQAKAHDLVEDQYWSHEAPNGKTPWSFMQEAGYSYQAAGENLAKCYDSPDALVKAWIASPTHEAVLVADYQDAGFGVQHSVKDNCDYVVGHFGRG